MKLQGINIYIYLVIKEFGRSKKSRKRWRRCLRPFKTRYSVFASFPGLRRRGVRLTSICTPSRRLRSSQTSLWSFQQCLMSIFVMDRLSCVRLSRNSFLIALCVVFLITINRNVRRKCIKMTM